jgi:acyl dehydratase
LPEDVEPPFVGDRPPHHDRGFGRQSVSTVRYFEDFSPGQTFDLGSYSMSREEIVEFASHWDPQPFHVDEQAAAATTFGGLIASGWHTACAMMRRYVDVLLVDAASMGSPGLSELRWLQPVRPDDVLHVTVSVRGVSESSVRPDRGTVHLLWRASNQNGEVVATMAGRGLFGRRPATEI